MGGGITFPQEDDEPPSEDNGTPILQRGSSLGQREIIGGPSGSVVTIVLRKTTFSKVGEATIDTSLEIVSFMEGTFGHLQQGRVYIKNKL